MKTLSLWAFTALAVAMLSLAAFSANETPELSGKSALTQMSSQSAATAATSYLVKVIYFIPRNRTPQPNGVQILKNYIKLCQQFYGTEMARNGIYKPGTTQGKTFEIEKDTAGEPIIRIVNGANDDTYYADDIFGKVLNEVTPTYPTTNSVLLIFPETYIMHENGYITGGAMGGVNYGLTGGSGGMAMVGGDTMWLLDQAKFADTSGYDGLKLPQFNYLPLVYANSYPYYQGYEIGQNASSFCGAAAHELGHGFGLCHCFINESGNWNGDIMGLGLRGFRGNFGNFPDEQVRIDIAEALQLAKSRFFNPGEPLTESNPPVQTSNVKLEDPMGNVSIHVKATATDTGSGLWRCHTAIEPPGTTISNEEYDEGGQLDFRITRDRNPVAGLYLGQSYWFFLRPQDNMGNRDEQRFWITVPGGLSQQYYADNGGWADVPGGGSSPNGNIRISIGMNYPTTDSVTLTPEVEIRPVDIPFTNNPNYTGQGVVYNGYNATGYVQIALAPGQYHWQYRLRSSDTAQAPSCWVTFGTNDSSVADITAGGKPSFTTQPLEQTKCLGQSVTLTTGVIGASPITYKWRKNGADIPGATSSSYTLSAVSAGDSASYDCVATNSQGSTASLPAFLTVREGTAPVVTTQPQNLSACWTWGTNVALRKTATASSCWTTDSIAGAVDGSTGSSPRWTTYNCGLQNSENYDVDLGGTYTISAINSYIYDDGEGVRTPQSFELYYRDTGGTWHLIAANFAPQGSMNGTYANTMIFSPVQATAARIVMIKRNNYPGYEGLGLTEFQVYSGAVGQGITFTTAATGASPLGYQWRKGGKDITGATSSWYVIPTATPDYAGSYDCVIHNDCGQVTTNTATLTVNNGTPAIITAQPVGLIKSVGESASFSVAATGTSLTYQWRKDWVNIPGATSTSYSIPSVATASAGTYDCVVGKACGAVASNPAYLAVGPTTLLKDLKKSIDGTSVILKAMVSTGAFGDSLYIEDTNRSCGIRVDKPGHGLTPGILIDVAGSVKTSSDQERYIEATVLSTKGTGKIKSLGMNNRSLGGVDLLTGGIGQKGVKDGRGPNNIGLLVTVFGKVTQIDWSGSYFYIDDGSKLRDGSRYYIGHYSYDCIGIRVAGEGRMYSTGQYVSVTGISTCAMTSSGLIRQIKPLAPDGVRTIK